MADFVGEVVMPGDVLHGIGSNTSEDGKNKLILGPGLCEDYDSVRIMKPGILRRRDPGVFWIDCLQQRYVPSRGDSVLGIVTQKAGDIFRVDIGGSDLASLSYLSFQDATKRNRPDVKVGDIVYAKLLVANKDMEPELVCIDSHGVSSGMGVIRNGGFLFHTPLHLVRKLLSPQCVLLKTLGNRFQFEIAVGMNGRIWVKAKTDLETVAMANAVMAAELMNNEQIKAMCKKLSRVVSGVD